ncbi:DUF1127 domain-containing protein [Roseovarius sp. MMSF_3281]|uniref:DUF1127 domain-containing protein n=1 Tax=Roseovarius sp. MMSF_3281 TaxID=3046694 RepID=UPI00273FD3C6|nr:DUF1127 domain-containing protein [Roseovarius sp. MMSF_3281]
MAYIPHTQANCAPRFRRQPLGLRAYVNLWKQRRALARMEDWQKRDLGLSETQIEAERRRAPWDAPANWRD